MAVLIRQGSASLELPNKVGAIAEEEVHHPWIVTKWGKELQWRTQMIGGQPKNDFVMAAKSGHTYARDVS